MAFFLVVKFDYIFFLYKIILHRFYIIKNIININLENSIIKGVYFGL